MARAASWIANVFLFGLSCFLLANLVNQVFAAMLTPPPEAAAVAPAAQPQARRGWAERRQILERNLFDSATLAPPAAELAAEEELEATRLPLKLLGTAAATDPGHSWAVIEDVEERDTRLVRVDDEVKRGASVIRIERRRVVLDENGSPRELALGDDEDEGAAQKVGRPGVQSAVAERRRPPRRAASARRAPTPPSETRALDEEPAQLDRADVDAALANPSSLLEQARFFPRYQDGQITGLQINDPKPGSLFEQAGIQNGEVIVEVNGLRIQSPEESRAVLEEMTQSGEWVVTIEGADGAQRTRTISVPRE
jgi:general secretion pathway protein C